MWMLKGLEGEGVWIVRFENWRVAMRADASEGAGKSASGYALDRLRRDEVVKASCGLTIVEMEIDVCTFTTQE